MEDIVGGNYIFTLRLPTAKWVSGKSGTLRLTFKNEMHTVEGKKFPFYRTIDLNLHSNAMSYTSAGEPLFYMYPVRFQGNDSEFIPYSTAENKCTSIGDNWRIPTQSELLLSYIFYPALGEVNHQYTDQGKEYNSNPYGGWDLYSEYWTQTSASFGNVLLPNITSTPIYAKWGNKSSDYKRVRCIYTGGSGTTKYPNVKANTTTGNVGALITLRDGNDGVSSSLISTNVVDDKLPPKLLVDNANISNNGKITWTAAKDACTAKGDGWRLPTIKEAQLIFALGGSKMESLLTNATGTTTLTWPSYTPIANEETIWTQTANGSQYRIIGVSLNNNNPGYWIGDHNTGYASGQDPWIRGRCVKSMQ